MNPKNDAVVDGQQGVAVDLLDRDRIVKLMVQRVGDQTGECERRHDSQPGCFPGGQPRSLAGILQPKGEPGRWNGQDTDISYIPCQHLKVKIDQDLLDAVG